MNFIDLPSPSIAATIRWWQMFWLMAQRHPEAELGPFRCHTYTSLDQDCRIVPRRAGAHNANSLESRLDLHGMFWKEHSLNTLYINITSQVSENKSASIYDGYYTTYMICIHEVQWKGMRVYQSQWNMRTHDDTIDTYLSVPHTYQCLNTHRYGRDVRADR